MHEFRINPPAPFNFEETAGLLSPGPDDLVDVFDGKRYTRLLELDGRMRLVLVSSLGAEHRPALIITLMNGTAQDEPPVVRVLSRMLGIDYDLGPFYELCRKDPQLYGLSRDHYGLKPPQRPGPFEALALAIAGQQVGTHFFRASLSPLAERHAYHVAYAGDTFYAFPDPRVVADLKVEELAVGPFTLQRAESLHALAQDVARGELDLEALRRVPLDALLERLQGRRGIGPLGAQLVALLGYGHLEVFPAADPALRRWIGRAVLDSDDVDESQVAEWAEQWGEHRGLVAVYIYAELLKHGEI